MPEKLRRDRRRMPLMWVLWGLGMIALLVVATGLHWLVGGKNTPPARSV